MECTQDTRYWGPQVGIPSYAAGAIIGMRGGGGSFYNTDQIVYVHITMCNMRAVT